MNCCAAVFRAARAGRCAVAAKPTDPPERITAASARGAYAAWTTTVPGENTPSSVHRPATPPPLRSVFTPPASSHLCFSDVRVSFLGSIIVSGS